MQDAVIWIQANWEAVFAAIGLVVTAASAIVKLTPSTKDDEILVKIVKFFELFSIFNKKTKA